MEREKTGRKASVDADTILALKEELEALHAHNDEVEARLHDSSEQLALHEKLVAQHGILKHVFGGAVSSFFDIRNFTVSSRNGNGNGKKKGVGDYD